MKTLISSSAFVGARWPLSRRNLCSIGRSLMQTPVPKSPQCSPCFCLMLLGSENERLASPSPDFRLWYLELSFHLHRLLHQIKAWREGDACCGRSSHEHQDGPALRPVGRLWNATPDDRASNATAVDRWIMSRISASTSLLDCHQDPEGMVNDPRLALQFPQPGP